MPSSCFKDVYLYLLQNKLPPSNQDIRKLENYLTELYDTGYSTLYDHEYS